MSVDMFFVLFGTISQILGLKCEGDSKKYLLLVLCTVILLNLKQSLTSFRNKPLTTLYSSVIETSIFIWCAHIWSWYMIYMKLNYILFIINYHWKVWRKKIYYHILLKDLSYDLLILLFSVWLWNECWRKKDRRWRKFVCMALLIIIVC